METSARHQVVVGVDGSPHARNALRWATRLAKLLDDDVTAVHGIGLLDRVHGELVTSHPHAGSLRDVVEHEWCAPLAQAGLTYRVEVVERPGVDALLGVAGERGTDLVVVGTRGLGLTTSQALGSTALQLLRRAQVPVLVAPDPGEGRSVEARRIAVGFDGSPDSHAALAWAISLAARLGATCEVTAVAGEADALPLGPSAAVTAAGEAQAPARLRALAEEACEPLRRLRLPYRVTVRRGAPAGTLVGVAADHHADLLVVGSSGEGAPGDPLAGSVSRLVAHNAGRPVVVVPAAWAARPEGTLVPTAANHRPS